MKRCRKIVAVIWAVILVISGLMTQTGIVNATGSSLLVPDIILAENIDKIPAAPGETITITVPVRAADYYAKAPIISINEKDTKAPVTLASKFSMETRVPDVKETLDISGYKTTYITFDVTVKETAKNGDYPLYLSFITTDSNNNLTEVTLKNAIIIRIKNEKSAPLLSVADTYYESDLKAGDKFDMRVDVTNLGQMTAKKVKVSLDGFTGDGILPNYTFASQSGGELVTNATSELIFPLKVANTVTDGSKPVTIVMECTDLDGGTYSEKTSVFIEVKGKKDTSDGDPNIVISDVEQSTSAPMAGGSVTMTFYIENKSKEKIKAIEIAPTNLTNANFSPDSPKPYQYVSSLSAGAKKKISMKLNVSEDVVEGLNELALSISYRGEDGKAYGPVTAKIFVLNVQNPEDEGSTPKLIISNFKTSEDNLKAGKTFDFYFDVQNTNTKVSAKNIKVTLSSTDNVFSVTKGSNSFYIPLMKPAETKQNVMNLKIKPDCVTKAYPIEIKFEYEYEGMPKPTDGTVSKGVEVAEIINLQVMENSRPSVSNITIGYGEVPIISTPTTLNFDFCNLGKSILSNVTARVESTDFEATGTIFIGNADPGSVSSQEIPITPMIEGPAKGTLIITYEDSNGTAVDVPTPFEGTVTPMQPMDPGMDNPDMMNPEIDQAKKPIVPIWAFILIQAVVFVIAIPIGKKITLGIYKKKLMKKEQEEL